MGSNPTPTTKFMDAEIKAILKMRTMAKARLELSRAVEHIATKHKLTLGDILRMLSEETKVYTKSVK